MFAGESLIGSSRPKGRIANESIFPAWSVFDRYCVKKHTSSKPKITRAPAKERGNFEGYVLGCINEDIPHSIMCRSELDEICLFVHSELQISFTFRPKRIHSDMFCEQVSSCPNAIAARLKAEKEDTRADMRNMTKKNTISGCFDIT